MSGRRDESLLLDDIVDASQRLIELGERARPGMLGADRDLAEMLQWNLAVLGEAVKRLQPATRERFPDVPWGSVARTRDRVIHHYEGIRWNIVHTIVADDLPALLPRLLEIRDILRVEFDS
jgi:uncharacterized protein with HEPN domain